MWGVRPSSLLPELSGLEAYLFDEVATLWVQRIEQGDSPISDLGEDVL